MDDRREAIPSWNGYVYQGEIQTMDDLNIASFVELLRTDF